MFAALLLVVAVTQYGYDPLCSVHPFRGCAQGVFYILRGIEGSVLFATIWYMRPALWPVCLWGFIEEGETAVCRAAIGFPGTPMPGVYEGLCDQVTGWPTYMLGIAAAAILVTRSYK